MQPDDIFRICNMMAMAGWLALLASPFFPKLADRIAALAIPVLLAIAYAGLVLAFWSGAEGGFDTLPNVMQLFTQPEIALAGWIHYLAFDLLIGAWEVRTARAERIPFLARRPLPRPDVPVRAGRLSGLHRPARRARRHPNRLARRRSRTMTTDILMTQSRSINVRSPRSCSGAIRCLPAPRCACWC